MSSRELLGIAAASIVFDCSQAEAPLDFAASLILELIYFINIRLVQID